jgi:integrase
MARKGRLDRGLVQRKDATGKTVWGVRLWHEGKERRFGGFVSKTQARDFYEKAKQEQKADRFFPERYQSGGYELVQDAINRYLQRTTTKKDQRGNRGFARWWGERFKGQRLNVIGTGALERAREDLLAKGCSPQRVNRYMEWIRHLLNMLVRDGKLHSNPAAKLTMYKEPSGKIRFLSEQEEAMLTEVLGPIYGRWVRFAILTGLRRAEQFALRWSDVDLERGFSPCRRPRAAECSMCTSTPRPRRSCANLIRGNGRFGYFQAARSLLT